MNNFLKNARSAAGSSSVPTPGPNATPPSIGIQPPHYTGDATDPAIELKLARIHQDVLLKCACGADLGGCACHRGRGTPERIEWLKARRAEALAAQGGVA